MILNILLKNLIYINNDNEIRQPITAVGSDVLRLITRNSCHLLMVIDRPNFVGHLLDRDQISNSLSLHIHHLGYLEAQGTNP